MAAVTVAERMPWAGASTIIHRMVNSVEVERLIVSRGGREVLCDLSATVAQGTVTGLLGPSGSGKTTLIRAIVGIQRTAGGSVRVLGLPAGAAALRGTVGYLTQAPAVYSDLTVRENLRYFAAALGAGPGSVDQVLADVSLGDEAGTRVDRLSGGQRSRVSLATALLGNPRVLVLDEPTVGLDPVLREELWSLFHRLGAAGATLLISSHVMEEATRCQRLLLLRAGRLLADDTPEALLRSTGQRDMDAAFLHLVRGTGPAS
jgi:ABC-2 type transport system ATP-binding protein